MGNAETEERKDDSGAGRSGSVRRRVVDPAKGIGVVVLTWLDALDYAVDD